MKIQKNTSPAGLKSLITRFWYLSAEKIKSIEDRYDSQQGAPVFTSHGRYTSRGWTDWTQGFQYGSSLLQFDATEDPDFLDIGRRNTCRYMSPHLSHFGVHDHGFNNVSTYGNLLRLSAEGRIEAEEWEQRFYALALQLSGAVQAKRWTAIPDGGYIYSFNGPHSLFADTIRSLRSLAVAYRLGHVMRDENDKRVSLLERLVQHARTTVRYNVYYATGRDFYDIRGRVAHESLFNLNNGSYRCPSSQQGFSPFTTWTRGLAWILLGCAEQLEFLATLKESELAPFGGKKKIRSELQEAALATADFYVENTAADGIPIWDTGAPRIHELGDYTQKVSDPFNDIEPVDSSAAAIAAQGLMRLGHLLGTQGHTYWQAGLTVLKTLLQEPYLSTSSRHQGLLLHSVYHRPNGWDPIPRGHRIPCGEASMWGDYHVREAVLYVQRLLENKPYLTFWSDYDPR